MGGSWVAIIIPPLLLIGGLTATSWATVLVWFFCLVFFGWAVIFYRNYSNRLKRGLKELALALEGLSSGEIDLDSIGGHISSNAGPVVAKMWHDYESTLLRVPEGERGIRVYSTIPAEYVLKDKAFHEGIGVYAVFPSLLTGLGILGTFLGLSLGLANVDLASDNLAVLRQGLGSLLSGARTAFVTSLWGIFLSILLTWLQKRFSARLAGELESICSLLDRLFPRRPAEVWLSEVYREAREQTAELKKFNDELAWNIAAALDERLAVRLTPALQNLLAAIERLTETGSTEIARVISQEAGTEVTRLGEILQQASSVLSDVLSASSELQRSVNETINRQLVLTASRVEESLGGSTARFSELVNQVEQAMEQMRQAVAEQVSWQKQQFEELLEKTQETTKSYLEDFLAKVGRALGNVSEQSSSAVAEMGGKVQSILEELRGRMKELGEEYATKSNEMRTALDEITTLLAVMERLVKEAATVLDAYRESAQPVREAGAVLGESVESVAEAGITLQKATREFKELWDDYRRSSVQAASDIKEALLSTQRMWQAYENKFGELREELEAVFDRLKDGLREYNAVVYEGINRYLTELDEHLEKALASLGAGVGELSDTLGDFMDLLKELSRKDRAGSERLR